MRARPRSPGAVGHQIWIVVGLFALLLAGCEDNGASGEATSGPSPSAPAASTPADSTPADSTPRDAASSGGSVSEEAFVAACQRAMNWDVAMCACAAERGAADLSEDQFAFVFATLEEDEARAESLRARLGVQDAARTGMFMASAGAACASGEP